MSLIVFGLGMLVGMASLCLQYVSGADVREMVVTCAFTLLSAVFAAEESVKKEIHHLRFLVALDTIKALREDEDE